MAIRMPTEKFLLYAELSLKSNFYFYTARKGAWKLQGVRLVFWTYKI